MEMLGGETRMFSTPPPKKKTSRLVMKWRGGNAKHRKNEIRARNQNKIYRVRYLITNREVV